MNGLKIVCSIPNQNESHSEFLPATKEIIDMTEFISEKDAAIQQIIKLTRNLYEALDSQNAQQILTAQQNLSAVAEMALALMDREADLSGRDKAIFRLLAEGAIKELPLKIQDPVNYPQIKRDLRLLKSSLVLLP
jgi:hypothetical protein